MQRRRDLTSAERLEHALTALVRQVLTVRLDDDGTPVERTAYALLTLLREDGPRRLSTLAEAVRLDRSTVSRQLAALEQRGLVERRPDGHDRRSHLLALTEDGQQILQATRTRRQQWLRDALVAWPEADRARLSELIERLLTDLFPPVASPLHTTGSTPTVTTTHQERP
jgi:DNA-binding MarR family transcriptional regulator